MVYLFSKNANGAPEHSPSHLGPVPSTNTERPSLIRSFIRTRKQTERIVAPLSAEDCNIQSMESVSPPKWHLAHTTWFFENIILVPLKAGYVPFSPKFEFLFNSYYNEIGPQLSRAQRGFLSRPSLEEIRTYRAYVEDNLQSLLLAADDTLWTKLSELTTLGISHEQQHQELLLMDIKHNFAASPLKPTYKTGFFSEPRLAENKTSSPPLHWLSHSRALIEVGYPAEGFSFDNEKPRHEVVVEDFRLASRLVTAGEYLAFVQDGGYRRPEFWLAEGWAAAQTRHWAAPLYWEKRGDDWGEFTLNGFQELAPHRPVCHVSFFEADAYARWAKKRLPTEEEWETIAAHQPLAGNFLESGSLHPTAATDSGTDQAQQLFGDVWEWTRSAYLPYPGYRPYSGILGEYNGKFMSGQYVLRGGCCVTPQSHMRATYRNYYLPTDRWQFSGLRLAEDGI